MTATSLLATGCKCRVTGHDREKAWAEIRAHDELILENGYPIPRSIAVGCEVCPGLCQKMNLGESMSMDELMFRYMQIARKPAERVTVATWDSLIRLACIAGVMGPDAEFEFLTLLYHDSEAVRYYAANQALDLAFAIEEPLEVLAEVGRGSSIYALRARSRLFTWQKEQEGAWPANPHILERQQRPHVR